MFFRQYAAGYSTPNSTLRIIPRDCYAAIIPGRSVSRETFPRSPHLRRNVISHTSGLVPSRTFSPSQPTPLVVSRGMPFSTRQP